MAHDRIYVYIGTDGTVTVRFPKGAMPDKETLAKVCEIINN